GRQPLPAAGPRGDPPRPAVGGGATTGDPRSARARLRPIGGTRRPTERAWSEDREPGAAPPPTARTEDGERDRRAAAGTVVEIRVEPGQAVEAGELLARIDCVRGAGRGCPRGSRSSPHARRANRNVPPLARGRARGPRGPPGRHPLPAPGPRGGPRRPPGGGAAGAGAP